MSCVRINENALVSNSKALGNQNHFIIGLSEEHYCPLPLIFLTSANMPIIFGHIPHSHSAPYGSEPKITL